LGKQPKGDTHGKEGDSKADGRAREVHKDGQGEGRKEKGRLEEGQIKPLAQNRIVTPGQAQAAGPLIVAG
jgi:hypothetical protein